MSKTKNFTANAIAGTTGYLIIVKGEVNCGKLEVEPSLTKKDPQGINDTISLLDIYPASDDPNGSFRNAEYNENITNQYAYAFVHLIDQTGQTIAEIPVQQA